MPRFVLGKVRKFHDPSSNRLGDIQEKPEGWIKTTPPPATNRVKMGMSDMLVANAVAIGDLTTIASQSRVR